MCEGGPSLPYGLHSKSGDLVYIFRSFLVKKGQLNPHGEYRWHLCMELSPHLAAGLGPGCWALATGQSQWLSWPEALQQRMHIH